MSTAFVQPSNFFGRMGLSCIVVGIVPGIIHFICFVVARKDTPINDHATWAIFMNASGFFWLAALLLGGGFAMVIVAIVLGILHDIWK